MSRTIVDIHILQTVPPSNLNRDDTGSPKNAIYGGVRRSRVSSQAWKRATRVAFQTTLDTSELGVRTKQVVEVLSRKIAELAPELAEQAGELAAETLKVVGIKLTAPKKATSVNEHESGYLLFLSARQIHNLAVAAIAAAAEGGKLTDALKNQNVKALADRDHSVDVSLFGRMVADVADLNVDAAAQVAHAISVHPVENEYDYYTAVDDRKAEEDETGAGMIGTVEFNSATLYRYATVDVNRLVDNLGDPHATQRAVEAFLRAFVTSMPTGKQNTFANRTLPDAVVVRLRDRQPISFVGAYETPVVVHDRAGRITEAAARLTEYAQEVERVYGEQPAHSWVVRVGDRTKSLASLGDEVTFDELISAVGGAVAGRMAAAA
ncbi:type I-E CRISPR-associated protein Cas7/Cse4/CasC [Natronosporangium hydrolyticum]|uniref:Type I-E CRISPR-associated protein Cas7/Cse4/CasC n=1 Tax=Natronosporangium hydrolyticum TaxID=2811111 RepID=A0A895YG06_9ACTN|nr:type I-E CRISPR-associated protein Cas7/Cse4/CasC [Natronosporangium hydrolyticum]QSB14409.1 type I-E CRISPR-associated protein Cas7/Cse4/CasC [Natronosporangium hydrolyticum]